MILVYSRRNDLVEKHQVLLDMLKWDSSPVLQEVLIKAYPCKVNQGMLIGSKLTANIYVDDILSAAAFKEDMIRLLTGIIEAIFTVCGKPNMAVRQCPLSIEKWHELIVGPKHIVLGLVVDMSKMTVGITDEYLDQVRFLLSQCDRNRRFFKVHDMQKLLGKLARLGEGAPWIFKLMSHLYTSLAFSLKSNAELLKKSSSGFRSLVKQIKTKNYKGKQSDHQRHLKYTMKMAAKMINKHGNFNLVNQTMRSELIFLSDTLIPNSGIKFETPIVHLIPRVPTASIIGNSSLVACGGYSINLKFWWHLSFPKDIVERALLHLKNNSDETSPHGYSWFVGLLRNPRSGVQTPQVLGYSPIRATLILGSGVQNPYEGLGSHRVHW
jgi:hypothetical protein